MRQKLLGFLPVVKGSKYQLVVLSSMVTIQWEVMKFKNVQCMKSCLLEYYYICNTPYFTVYNVLSYTMSIHILGQTFNLKKTFVLIF